MNGTERRMQAIQFATMGYMDMWTLMEIYEMPNVGSPPAIPLPPLKPLKPEEQQMILQQSVQQALSMSGGAPQQPDQPAPPPGPVQLPDGRQFILDPASGQIMELRVPTQITERLQAQQLLGLGMMANAQGRKATNDEPPHSETKGDEPGGRQTISTSKK